MTRRPAAYASKLALLFALARLASACSDDPKSSAIGGASENGGGAGGSGASAASTVTGAGAAPATATAASGGGSAPLGCPTSEPVSGQPCDPLEVPQMFVTWCEYGDDPRPACRSKAECVARASEPPVWQVDVPACPPLSDVGCPQGSRMPTGGDCTPDKLCLYTDGWQCGCPGTCNTPSGTVPCWSCVGGPPEPCPVVAPDAGQACALDGVRCGYGACYLGTLMDRQCMGGVWWDLTTTCR